jgi:CubicO group peptidase (beta-lactamase class C family)
MKKIALLAALLAALPLAQAAAATPAPASRSARSAEQQVDALFAKWNRPGKPGAMVAVIRDGKVLLSKGYGFADLERSVPITPSTVFTVGSNSKQFTAFAIHLLAQDGKLSLDDDIRKYLPEVPDFGKTITIRHLLHHTSGLRDYFNLMLLTGWRGDDVITQEDALTLVERQRALNFAPGQEHLYSNTGYMLLGLIVDRVSGKPLAEFARERIFEPLGMKHTQFLHGYGTLVPARALSYVPSAAGGYQTMAVGDSADGAGGLVTTAGDLALWDRNFYDGRVGGKALVARMQATGVLNDGTPINYASGLLVDAHRGRRLVEHGGTINGFQAQLTRFPDQHFSVMVLANTADLDMYQTVRRIADIYLDPKLSPELAPPSVTPEAPRKVFKEVAVDPARLDALVGFYALSPQAGIDFTKENGRLMARATGLAKVPVFAWGEREFFAKAVDAQFSFDPPGPDGVIAGGVLHQNGQDIPARRVARPVLPAEALKKFEGDFYSDELRVLYSVASKDGGLVLTHPRGTAALDVDPTSGSAIGFGDIKYQCSAQDACTGFTVSTGRVRQLQFTRVTLVQRP